MKNTLFTIIATLFLAVSAQAGWIVEPLVGYQMGSWKTEDKSTPVVESNPSETGILAGLKLGFLVGKVSLGAEYSIITGGKYKEDGTTTDFSRTDTFVNLGYEGGRWRALLGYGIGNSMTIVGENASPDVKFSGSSMKLGIGFFAMRHMSVNLEYIIPAYTKYEVGSQSGDLDDIYTKHSASSYNINFSFPFMF